MNPNLIKIWTLHENDDMADATLALIELHKTDHELYNSLINDWVHPPTLVINEVVGGRYPMDLYINTFMNTYIVHLFEQIYNTKNIKLLKIFLALYPDKYFVDNNQIFKIIPLLESIMMIGKVDEYPHLFKRHSGISIGGVMVYDEVTDSTTFRTTVTATEIPFANCSTIILRDCVTPSVSNELNENERTYYAKCMLTSVYSSADAFRENINTLMNIGSSELPEISAEQMELMFSRYLSSIINHGSDYVPEFVTEFIPKYYKCGLGDLIKSCLTKDLVLDTESLLRTMISFEHWDIKLSEVLQISDQFRIQLMTFNYEDPSDYEIDRILYIVDHTMSGFIDFHTQKKLNEMLEFSELDERILARVINHPRFIHYSSSITYPPNISSDNMTLLMPLINKLKTLNLDLPHLIQIGVWYRYFGDYGSNLCISEMYTVYKYIHYEIAETVADSIISDPEFHNFVSIIMKRLSELTTDQKLTNIHGLTNLYKLLSDENWNNVFDVDLYSYMQQYSIKNESLLFQHMAKQITSI